jgi:Histidinol dehydrogenase
MLAYTQKGLEKAAKDLCVLAEKEGLAAHAASVNIRLAKRTPIATDLTQNGSRVRGHGLGIDS